MRDYIPARATVPTIARGAKYQSSVTAVAVLRLFCFWPLALMDYQMQHLTRYKAGTKQVKQRLTAATKQERLIAL
jgi:hypothetical protein